MNGVEAAASLFGSEDSEADLFATLGTDTTSLDNPLCISTDPLFPASEEQAYDLASHTAIYDYSVLAEHPASSVAAQESIFEPSDHLHDFNHQGEWAKISPTSNYSGEFLSAITFRYSYSKKIA